MPPSASPCLPRATHGAAPLRPASVRAALLDQHERSTHPGSGHRRAAEPPPVGRPHDGLDVKTSLYAGFAGVVCNLCALSYARFIACVLLRGGLPSNLALVNLLFMVLLVRQ